MKKTFKFIIFTAIALCTAGFSEISTIYSIGEIKNHLEIDQDTLVVFDIDEVLISSEDKILQEKDSKHIPKKWDSFSQSQKDEIVGIMFEKTEYILVDPLIPHFIDLLKKNGIKTIALTNNNSGKLGKIVSNEDRIENRLLEKNISFKDVFPIISKITFKDLVNMDETPPLYKNGILYVGSYKNKEKGGKGPLLGIFLDKIKWSPKKVIFFDDESENLISMQKELEKRNIAYEGYHFKGAEKLPNTFDERILALKYFYLSQKMRWLTNKEAIEILSKPYDAVTTYEK